jgi:predicted O-methyltransferase YrrM
MSLSLFLKEHGFTTFEGYSQQNLSQVSDLIELTKKPNIDIMEIGFNAGHSAEIFLKNNSTLKLLSFDLGKHDYVNIGKKYIDNTYPNRHTLILGNSLETVPEYIKSNKDKRFDVIFIDGGHSYKIAKSDIENCLNLAHKDTLVILDDTIFIEEWVRTYNKGPTKIWLELLNSKKVIEFGRKHYKAGKGMVWGKYII